MKKIIGFLVVFIGCAISAVDLGRMIIGLAYGWDSILGGFVMSVLGWVFLLDSHQRLLLDAAKSAVCIAAIVVFSLLANGENQSETITATNDVKSIPYTSKYTYVYPQEKEPVAHMTCSWCQGSGVCKQCDGSGRNDFTGILAGFGCTLCERTRRCFHCGGDGYVDVY